MAQVKKGDRVQWTRRGETLTGTVEWNPFPGDDRVSVNCDQIKTYAGGVPIGRIEHPPIDALTVLEPGA